MKRYFKLIIAVILAVGISAASFGSSYSVATNSGTEITNGSDLSSQAKDALDIINEFRADNGLSPLKWDDRLASAARQRAAETVFRPGHTRPDGRQWNTVSSYAFGENLTAGTTLNTGQSAVDQWMNSPAHKALLLRDRYTTIGIGAYAPDDDISGYSYYWALLVGTGSSAPENAKIKGETTGKATPAKTETTTGALSQQKAVDTVKSANAKAGQTVVATFRNAGVLTPEAIKGMNGAVSKGKNLLVYADTVDAGGTAVVGRLYLYPQQLAQRTTNLSLGVSPNSAGAKSVKATFEKGFTNKIAVISFEEKGSFGMATPVAVKIDLDELKTDSLVFYNYNKAENKYVRFYPTYKIDDKGYLKFSVSQGGDIVITDRALEKK